MNKEIIKNAADICNNVANAIRVNQTRGIQCNSICPGRDTLINVVNQLIVEIKDTEPECFQRLIIELQNIKNPYSQCVLPHQFGAICAIIDILKNKYIDAKEIKEKYLSAILI